jgi:hypothetical protein
MRLFSIVTSIKDLLMSKEMSNCEKFRIALKPYVGEVLTRARIKQIVQESYPKMPDGSANPSEHGVAKDYKGNKTPCSCATTRQRIFNRVKRGVYEVLPL